ncbi:MAG: hypothetical protein ACOCQX_02020 [Candidatus Nanoarchaeia archaeon]
MKKGLFIVMFALLLAVSFTAAQEQVVINSRDWQDVYSGMLYSALNDIPGNYPIEETRARLLLDTLDKDKEEVLLIEGDNPYISNFRGELQSDYNVELLDYSESVNLELAQNFSKFIVMDSRFAYNAVSLAPFASMKGHYVLFANADNINEITQLLDENAEEVIRYGYVDREVSEALEEFNPEIINEGSKYENNIEITEKFIEEKNPRQFILTNGQIIEPQIFTGKHPVVFIGKSNIPELTMEFLKESEIKHAVLIGNELTELASTLKKEADMKIMVKFAKGINKEKYTLDIFELPTPDYNPRVSQAFYNTLTDELVITLENEGPTPTIVKGSYSVRQDNTTIATVGDEDPQFIPGNGILTRTYETEIEEDKINIKADIVYGEDVNSLEELNVQTTPLEFIEINDQTNVSFEKIHYDKTIKRFVIDVKNTGEDTVFITGYINQFLLNEREQRLSTDKIIEIAPGETGTFKIKADLTPLDIEENEEINLQFRYGAQENILLKEHEETTELVVKTSAGKYIIIGGAAFLVAMLLIFAGWRAKKKKQS